MFRVVAGWWRRAWRVWGRQGAGHWRKARRARVTTGVSGAYRSCRDRSPGCASCRTAESAGCWEVRSADAGLAGAVTPSWSLRDWRGPRGPPWWRFWPSLASSSCGAVGGTAGCSGCGSSVFPTPALRVSQAGTWSECPSDRRPEAVILPSGGLTPTGWTPHATRTHHSMNRLRSIPGTALALPILAAVLVSCSPKEDAAAPTEEQVKAIHDRVMTIDTHVDINAAQLPGGRAQLRHPAAAHPGRRGQDGEGRARRRLSSSSTSARAT